MTEQQPRLTPEREQEIRQALKPSSTGLTPPYVAELLAELDARTAERDMARAFNDQRKDEARAERADRISAQNREAAANERVRELETALGDIARALLAQS